MFNLKPIEIENPAQLPLDLFVLGKGWFTIFPNKCLLYVPRYKSKITKEIGGAFTEYDFVQKNVLLRLTHSLTPQQAADYEKVLKEIVK